MLTHAARLGVAVLRTSQPVEVSLGDVAGRGRDLAQLRQAVAKEPSFLGGDESTSGAWAGGPTTPDVDASVFGDELAAPLRRLLDVRGRRRAGEDVWEAAARGRHAPDLGGGQVQPLSVAQRLGHEARRQAVLQSVVAPAALEVALDELGRGACIQSLLCCRARSGIQGGDGEAGVQDGGVGRPRARRRRRGDVVAKSAPGFGRSRRRQRRTSGAARDAGCQRKGRRGSHRSRRPGPRRGRRDSRSGKFLARARARSGSSKPGATAPPCHRRRRPAWASASPSFRSGRRSHCWNGFRRRRSCRAAVRRRGPRGRARPGPRR